MGRGSSWKGVSLMERCELTTQTTLISGLPCQYHCKFACTAKRETPNLVRSLRLTPLVAAGDSNPGLHLSIFARAGC